MSHGYRLNNKPWVHNIQAFSQKTLKHLSHALITIGTLPYYRFFRQNTLLPILHIIACVQRGDNEASLVILLTNWRERKLYELHFIQVASTILAGAVIGCFSWPQSPTTPWIGPALWYWALVLAITAILLSSSQAFIFSALNTPTAALNSSGDFRRYLALIIADGEPWEPGNSRRRRECAPRWKMVFTWQAPMMLMAYAVTSFMGGLLVYVCTPLFNGEFGAPEFKTAIFFLATAAATGAIFIYCSFYAYRFIDLDKIVEVDLPCESSQPYPSDANHNSSPAVSRRVTAVAQRAADQYQRPIVDGGPEARGVQLSSV